MSGHRSVYVYGARSPTFLSGSPYYFARALRALGGLAVHDLAPKRVREVPFAFARWSLRSGSRRPELFLLSQAYHDACGRDFVAPADSCAQLVVFGQVAPRRLLALKRERPQTRLMFYLDATLRDLLQDFDYARNAAPALQRRLIADEAAGYRDGDRFLAFHDGVRDRLVADYGVAPERIQVLGRGVNLDAEEISRHRAARPPGENGVKLMVVGKGPRRKGVFPLIEAIDALDPAERAGVTLTVAGPQPEELPDRPYLRRLGFMGPDLRDRLAAEMAAADLGVLLSEAEGLPGSIWEFLALGVPCWVSNLPFVGPALQRFAVLLEPLPIAPPALAARLRSFLQEPGKLHALRRRCLGQPDDLTWAPQATAVARYIAA